MRGLHAIDRGGREGEEVGVVVCAMTGASVKVHTSRGTREDRPVRVCSESRGGVMKMLMAM